MVRLIWLLLFASSSSASFPDIRDSEIVQNSNFEPTALAAKGVWPRKARAKKKSGKKNVGDRFKMGGLNVKAGYGDEEEEKKGGMTGNRQADEGGGGGEGDYSYGGEGPSGKAGGMPKPKQGGGWKDAAAREKYEKAMKFYTPVEEYEEGRPRFIKQVKAKFVDESKRPKGPLESGDEIVPHFRCITTDNDECRLPFKFRGVWYDNCTSDHTYNDVDLWCVKLSFEGLDGKISIEEGHQRHRFQNWDYCSFCDDTDLTDRMAHMPHLVNASTPPPPPEGVTGSHRGALIRPPGEGGEGEEGEGEGESEGEGEEGEGEGEGEEAVTESTTTTANATTMGGSEAVFAGKKACLEDNDCQRPQFCLKTGKEAEEKFERCIWGFCLNFTDQLTMGGHADKKPNTLCRTDSDCEPQKLENCVRQECMNTLDLWHLKHYVGSSICNSDENCADMMSVESAACINFECVDLTMASAEWVEKQRDVFAKVKAVDKLTTISPVKPE